MTERTAKMRGRVRHRWVRFRRWWSAFRHVPHSRAVWCGDQFCPYAMETIR